MFEMNSSQTEKKKAQERKRKTDNARQSASERRNVLPEQKPTKAK